LGADCEKIWGIARLENRHSDSHSESYVPFIKDVRDQVGRGFV